MKRKLKVTFGEDEVIENEENLKKVKNEGSFNEILNVHFQYFIKKFQNQKMKKVKMNRWKSTQNLTSRSSDRI